MSEENVEIVRRSYEAWASGDIDAWLGFFAPEVEWLPPPAWAALEVGESPEAQVVRGHSGLREFVRITSEMWEQQKIEPERFLDAGDRVVALVRLRVRGRSGLEIDEPWAHLTTVRDGKIVRVELHSERAQALEAAGLTE